MASIRTITLSGAEQAVSMGGVNCAIRNDGAETIYASADSGITAGADGVLSVPAGGSATLYDVGGTVFLLGTGSVQLVGSDYNDNPFKTVSSAGGSGADDVARAAISAHAGNAEIHVTADEKDAWSAKAEVSDIPDISGKADKSDTYTKSETDSVITERVAAIVAGAPEDFDTLKEMSDWIDNHEDSAAAMNSAIVENTRGIEDVNGRLDALSYSNPNLLINPDFRINQRSASGAVTEAGYFVDRWQLVSGSVTVNADKSLTLNGTIKQVLENAAGTSVTASAGAGAASYDDSTRTFTLTASGAVIRWTKLEVGAEATRFSPPDTATELAKCQRFGFVWDGFVRYHSAYTTGTQHTFVIPTPVPLRASPTINGGLTFFKALSPTSANVIADQTYSVVGGIMSSNFCLRATTAEAHEWVMVGTAGGKTFVDAEIY